MSCRVGVTIYKRSTSFDTLPEAFKVVNAFFKRFSAEKCTNSNTPAAAAAVVAVVVVAVVVVVVVLSLTS